MKYLREDQYVLGDSINNELVLVDINLLLTRLKVDSPEYFIGVDTKNEGSVKRVKDAISFIKRNEYRKNYFEPALLGFDFDKIGVVDGRHRIVAAKKMGYTHIYVEVPQEYKKIFVDLV
jgi:hypothetical protein